MFAKSFKIKSVFLYHFQILKQSFVPYVVLLIFGVPVPLSSSLFLKISSAAPIIRNSHPVCLRLINSWSHFKSHLEISSLLPFPSLTDFFDLTFVHTGLAIPEFSGHTSSKEYYFRWEYFLNHHNHESISSTQTFHHWIQQKPTFLPQASTPHPSLGKGNFPWQYLFLAGKTEWSILQFTWLRT